MRNDDDTHPAFAHILDELTPDEARMLRFLCAEGPQPSVDVRTNRPFGVGSELVAGGLSMIGLQAGVRHPDRTQSYLNNLERLGLIWFSRETVEPGRYQVVEVQPEVVEALKRRGLGIGDPARRELIAVLERQQLNAGLPRYLPPETVVAHKTGTPGLIPLRRRRPPSVAPTPCLPDRGRPARSGAAPAIPCHRH